MDLKDKICHEIDLNFSSRIESLVSQLVEIESHSQKEGCEQEISQFIYQECKTLGCTVEVREVATGRPNVIASIGEGTEKPVLMLNGHMDTVPAPVWKKGKPYKLLIENGRLYGRGAVDMKGPIASCIIALGAIKNILNDSMRGKLVFTAVVGEEGSCSLGTYEILRNGPKADMVIVCEPTNLNVGISQKGFQNFTIKFKGKASHSGNPQAGINAVSIAARFLEKHQRYYEKKFRAYRDPLLGLPTLIPVYITGGGRADTVPDECLVKFNCRYIPGMNPSDFEDYLDQTAKKVCKSYGTNSYTIERDLRKVSWNLEEELFYSGSPFKTDEKSELVENLKSVATAITGRPPEYFGAGYWSDAGLFGDLSIPTVLFGPGRMEVAHGYEEFIEKSQIIEAAKIYALLAAEVCS